MVKINRIADDFGLPAIHRGYLFQDNRVHIGPKIDLRVVTLGLDGAGKTSILFKLKQNEFMITLPTIGFNIDIIEYKNVKFTIWDLGGQPKLRPLWKHYYFNTQVLRLFWKKIR